MKDKRNKSSQRDQQQNTSQEKQTISNRRTGSQAEDQKHSKSLHIPEKKPYSHRTGDATNFGDRSYQED